MSPTVGYQGGSGLQGSRPPDPRDEIAGVVAASRSSLSDGLPSPKNLFTAKNVPSTAHCRPYPCLALQPPYPSDHGSRTARGLTGEPRGRVHPHRPCKTTDTMGKKPGLNPQFLQAIRAHESATMTLDRYAEVEPGDVKREFARLDSATVMRLSLGQPSQDRQNPFGSLGIGVSRAREVPGTRYSRAWAR